MYVCIHCKNVTKRFFKCPLYRERHISTYWIVALVICPIGRLCRWIRTTDMEIGRQLLAKMRRKRKNDHQGQPGPTGLEIHFYTQATQPVVKYKGCYNVEDLCVECAKVFGKLSSRMQWEVCHTIALKFLSFSRNTARNKLNYPSGWVEWRSLLVPHLT